jgi:hypothetical protein
VTSDLKIACRLEEEEEIATVTCGLKTEAYDRIGKWEMGNEIVNTT